MEHIILSHRTIRRSHSQHIHVFHLLLFLTSIYLVLSLLFGCKASDEPGIEENVINLFSFTDEVPNMMEKYKELNLDFDYEIDITTVHTMEGVYTPDIYCVESAFVLKYTQGEAAFYATPYE